jgi:hypothetical protein
MKFLTMHMKTNKKESTFIYIYIYKGREIWPLSQIHSDRGGEFNNVSMGFIRIKRYL